MTTVSIGRLLTYVRPYRKRMVGNFFCMVVASSMTSSLPILVKWVDTKVLHNPDSHDARDWIILLPLLILGVTLLKSLGQYGQQYLSESISEKISMDLRFQLFRKIQDRPLSYFYKIKKGALTSRFIADVGLNRGLYAQLLGSVLSAILTSFGVMAVIVYSVSWKLSVPSLLVMLVAVKPIHHFGKKIRRDAAEGQEATGEVTANLIEVFGAIKIVKAFVQEKNEAIFFPPQRPQENPDIWPVHGSKSSELASPGPAPVGIPPGV